MNYGAQIKQALLEREKRRKQEEKERLENRLKEFAESWLSEARTGKGTEFFKLFSARKEEFDVISEWCKQNGFTVKKDCCGGYRIIIPLESNGITEGENV